MRCCYPGGFLCVSKDSKRVSEVAAYRNGSKRKVDQVSKWVSHKVIKWVNEYKFENNLKKKYESG